MPPADDDEDEEDYMTMSIAEPPKPESSLQRLAREKRARAARARPKSKAQLAAEAAAARDAGLGTALDASNKGFRMMQRLGFAGGSLGPKAGAAADGTPGLAEPIRVEMRERRAGLGAESGRAAGEKRRAEEAGPDAKDAAKKARVSEDEFVSRVRDEQRAAHVERVLHGAMRVARRIDEEQQGPTAAERRAAKKPNVLWRRLVRDEKEGEHERGQRKARRFLFKDADEDDFDAYEQDDNVIDDDGEDGELEAHLALSHQEQLDKLLRHLRATHRYCYFCKTDFPDDAMDGCPGVTEEDHD